jgi:hypothetical protein
MGSLPRSCQEHGCTPDDCVCWEYDEQAEDAELITAAFGRADVDQAAFTIEYIDDARMLTVLGPGGLPTRRLYLDETTAQIDTVPLHIEYAVDARDYLTGATFSGTTGLPYGTGIPPAP